MSNLESKVFQSPATLDGIMPRKDGTMSLRFVTQELSADEKAMLMDKFFNQFGYVLFKENAFKDEEIPQEDAEGMTSKKTFCTP